MIQLIAIGGVAALGLVGVLVLALKLAAAKSEQADARSNASAEHDRAEDYRHERDGFAELLAKDRATAEDLKLRLAEIEAERNALARDLAAAKVSAIATAPLEQGAAIVNDLFSTPILGDELEKP